jgi:hypothetical protein
MAFEKPKVFISDHKLETGIVTSLAAAGAATGYAIYKKQREKREREMNEVYADNYEKRLMIFEHPKLAEEKRFRIAQIAVHIFFRNEMGEEIATKEYLMEHFENKHDISLTRHNLTDYAGYLLQNKLIVLQHGSGEFSHVQGYRTMPALEWGMNYSEIPHPTLLAAYDDYYPELNGNL